MLDVSFGEDAKVVRKDDAPKNLALALSVHPHFMLDRRNPHKLAYSHNHL
jgi:hypothetical protein